MSEGKNNYEKVYFCGYYDQLNEILVYLFDHALEILNGNFLSGTPSRISPSMTCMSSMPSVFTTKSICPTGKDRTVASGIAKWYAPEDLVGKKVVVVANLKPYASCVLYGFDYGIPSH